MNKSRKNQNLNTTKINKKIQTINSIIHLMIRRKLIKTIKDL